MIAAAVSLSHQSLRAVDVIKAFLFSLDARTHTLTFNKASLSVIPEEPYS